MARNLEEFAAGLAEIDDGVYDYHVQGHSQDLSRWVREVAGDGALADAMEKVHTRSEAAELVAMRVKELKKVIGLK